MLLTGRTCQQEVAGLAQLTKQEDAVRITLSCRVMLYACTCMCLLNQWRHCLCLQVDAWIAWVAWFVARFAKEDAT